jgi:ribosomal protein S18 acetylase RimI-like enzyme
MILIVSSDHGPRLDRAWFVEGVLAGERLVDPAVRVLGPGEHPGRGKVLLVRAATVPLLTAPLDTGPTAGSGVLAGTLDAVRLAPPHERLARLQLPAIAAGHHARGAPEALVEAIRRDLLARGVEWLVAAADEDGDALGWYRRLGFQDLVRVSRA